MQLLNGLSDWNCRITRILTYQNSFRKNNAQIFLLIILLEAMFNFFIGTFFSLENEQKAQGFFGFSKSNYDKSNFIQISKILKIN